MHFGMQRSLSGSRLCNQKSGRSCSLSAFHLSHDHFIKSPIVRFNGQLIEQLMDIADPDRIASEITLRQVFIVISLTTPHPVSCSRKSHSGHDHQLDLVRWAQRSLVARFFNTERATHQLRRFIVKEAHSIPLNTGHGDSFSLLDPASQNRLGRRFVRQGAKGRHDLRAAKALTTLHLPKNARRSPHALLGSKRAIALTHRCTNLAFIHLYTYF